MIHLKIIKSDNVIDWCKRVIEYFSLQNDELGKEVLKVVTRLNKTQFESELSFFLTLRVEWLELVNDLYDSPYQLKISMEEIDLFNSILIPENFDPYNECRACLKKKGACEICS